MKYEVERSEGIPCDRRDCHNWDDGYEGWCHAENSVGDPGPSYCAAYRPNSKMEEKMPGPVSDSYDPEFGTSSNAEDLQLAIEGVVEKMGRYLGPELKNIVGVLQGPAGKRKKVNLSEREMRVIRFALNRALESI